MKKTKYLNWIILVIFLFLAIFVFATKLDITIPTVKFKFVFSDLMVEQRVEYSYSYQGNDLIRGVFGGYGYSESKIATTGEVVEIPTKRIISYWPFSKFTYLLINGDQIKTTEGYCSWAASIWDDGYKYLLDEGIKSIENIAWYPYLINTNNEYTFDGVKDKVIEVKCL